MQLMNQFDVRSDLDVVERIAHLPTRFSYDGVEDRGRRAKPKASLLSEDEHLEKRKRKQLIATTRDVQRNFVVASWAIRKHLDYVSSFTFQSKTGDSLLDDEIESLINAWSARLRCDAARRHPLRRLIRLIEARRQLDGDCGVLKIAAEQGSIERGRLQAIEAELITTDRVDNLPEQITKNSANWVHGIRISGANIAVEYALARRRLDGKLEFDRVVPAPNLCLHASYDSGRIDQVRGISPLAAALNTLRDIYEGFDYSLARLKVAQMFGLVLYRDAELALDGTSAPTIDANKDGAPEEGYKINFDKGPVLLDLDPGDRAEFLDNKTPAQETTNFLQLMIQIALKSLDIPFSFFDESFTNFYGSRGGLIQYLKSCKTKIADLQDLLDEITRWIIGIFIFDRLLVLPSRMDFDSLKWEWVSDGVPWWDPEKEVRGHAMAVAAGFDSPQRVCRMAGTDFFANVDAIAEAQDYAISKGVNLVLPGIGAFNAPLVDNQITEDQ